MTEPKKTPIQTVTLADIYFRQGFLQKARAVYEGLLVDHPNHVQALQRIGEIDRLLLEQQAEGLNGGRTSQILSTFNRWLVAIDKRRGYV